MPPSSSQINENECLPWNMPSPDGHPCCNPIEQHDFFDTFHNLDMSKTVMPGSAQQLCFPDCASTVYSTSVTTAPFRKCDPANMGLSRLCKVSPSGSSGLVPQKWGEAVLDSYKNSPAGSVPQYISDIVQTTQGGDSIMGSPIQSLSFTVTVPGKKIELEYDLIVVTP